ncbi:MAG TPA: glycine cleavage system protein GcvH [Rhodospirillales bacterium]|nr:glycine cleavage system protein GcvH [Rhodospirillales bacterium]
MSVVRFTPEHEWIRIEDGIGLVGITDYAQQQLGDVVFVELPAVGTAVSKGEQAAVVESVKAASEVYAPASGEVVAVNEQLADEPGLVNAEPMAGGWFLKIRLSDDSELQTLMDEPAYLEHVRSLN